MDEVIRHAKLCYTQFKQRYENTKTWQDKNKNSKFDPRKKQFKYPHHASHSAPVKHNRFSGQQQSVSVQNNSRPTDSVNKPARPPLQCWGCKEPHLYRDFPLNKNINLT
jgi:hypothetical protein